MKKILKNLKKYYKLIILIIILIIIFILSLLIYKNMFEGKTSERLDGVENYNLTKKEISKVEKKLKEIDSVSDVEIYTNYKIIKIFLELNDEVEFEKVKSISSEAVNKISKNNLSFYDLEIFIDTKNEESEVYPKIGYKYKTDSDFTWNR